LQQIQRLYDLQMTQVTDLYDVQARLALVEAELIDLQSEAALAREVLRSASGLTVGPVYHLEESAEIPSMTTPIEQWVELALAQNPSLQARRFAAEAAEERISESRGAYMPRVNLILQQQRSELGFDNTPIPRTDTGYVGLDISIPLYAGGRNRAAVSEAVSMHSIAENELLQVRMETSERTRAAFLQVRSGENRTEAALRVAESAELSATARQRGFELGTVTSVDVLNSLRDQFAAERDLQRTRYEHIKARLALLRESGTLSPEDLVEVSGWLEAPEN
jgi:outer membrane protein